MNDTHASTDDSRRQAELLTARAKFGRVGDDLSFWMFAAYAPMAAMGCRGEVRDRAAIALLQKAPTMV